MSLREPIAIVGMGCRLPGAASPAALWQLLIAGTDAVGPMPDRRIGIEAFYDPTPGTAGKFVTRDGGFVPDIDRFDAGFFGISPREAIFMDPQQRILLEIAWEAFEDAGIVPERIAGSETGVFVGMWTNEYEDYVYGSTSDIDLYVTTGGGRHSASGRLSYAFDLRGPNLTLDTACSSSLVALHLACNSLRRGESKMALAAGVNLILQPHISIGYSRSRMLSPRGRCRFGDATADGYVRSEGVGLVVLKPLSAAIADRDMVHAVILGSAVNNDGRGSGLLVAPSVVGQEAMLREAYRDAGVSPGDVQYVEAHGTGTRVGDPVELQALSSVLASGRAADRRCLVGSIKTNIGHAEAASGIAGLIKTVLAMEHGVIPASLHLKEPNPSIPWDTMPLAIVRESHEWPAAAGARVAGVNSFGITGSNAHVIIADAPVAAATQGAWSHPFMLPMSAHTPEALRQLVRSYVDLLRGDGADLVDVCHTAALRRTHHEHRAAVIGRTREQMVEALDACSRDEASAGLATGRAIPQSRHRIAFVFPGQGSQWLGMARTLMPERPFAEAIERCDAAVRALTGWSVIAELHASEAESRLSQIDVVQPVLFSVQVALAALWRSWGLEPEAVIGHSMGEIAAAHVSGALSIDDAARIICRRSALLRRTSGKGAMALVELTLADAEAALAGYEDRLSVAVSNSSRSTVISGDPSALEQLLASLVARVVFCRRVKVDVASHSPQMDALTADLLEAVQGIAPRRANLTFCSTVLASPVDTTTLTPAYWVRNLRAPVLFSAAVQRLLSDGVDTFIEMSPHPLLVSAVQETATERDGTAVVVVPSGRRDEDEAVVTRTSAATLHCHGRSVAWDRLAPVSGRVVSLPTFPWQRERFWFEASGTVTALAPIAELPGRPLRPSLQSNTAYFEFDLSVDQVPFLSDHRVRGSIVVPAAFFLEASREAARRSRVPADFAFESVTIGNALVLPESGARTVQLVVSVDGAGRGTFQLMSREADQGDSQEQWTSHASGTIRRAIDVGAPAWESRETIESRCAASFDDHAHYAAMSGRGLQYGPAFRVVGRGARGHGELIASLAAKADSNQRHRELYTRTALLDGCMQAVVAALPTGESGDTFVPVAVRRLRLPDRIDANAELAVHVTFDSDVVSGSDSFEASFAVLAADGRVVVHGEGVRLQRIENERKSRVRGALFHLAWKPQALPAKAPALAGSWVLVARDGPVAASFAGLIAARGGRPVFVVPGSAFRLAGSDRYEVDLASEADVTSLLVAESDCTAVVHLLGLDGSTEPGAAELDATMSAVHLVRALASLDSNRPPRLWCVTAGTQAVDASGVSRVAGSALWGLRSVVATEEPRLRCSVVDLSDNAAAADLEALVDEIAAGTADDEVALRAGTRYTRRLARDLRVSETDNKTRPASGRAYRAATATPGILDALGLEEMPRRAPGDQEVEIEVAACGLNFMNVMSALGIYPGYPQGLGPLGIECAGRVIRTGSGVADLHAGDRVMAFAHDSLATHAVAHRALVRRTPDGLGLTDAATISVAFLTAHYALVHLGRIARGERVLIHSATGGVGLAALQVARAAGAEVYATAGSEEKRSLLRSMGVAHVFDSRSLDFADDIRGVTAGEGVDLVLNSLAGEAIPAGLSVLRAGGRFLEIGKRDIYENRAIGLLPFRRNLSYYAIDLDGLARQNPVLLGEVFDQIVARLADGTYRPLPAELFPVAELGAAFRRMAQGAHTGKIVLQIDPQQAPVRPRATAVPRDWSAGTILITGGTGGLGLVLAQWLVEQGAKHLVLVGRRGVESDGVRRLRERGAAVTIAAGDVANAADVRRIVTGIGGSQPPLRGVIHAAGILDDATIGQLTREQLERVAAPKIAGAWNLHTATIDQPLDFFVLFSSVTSFIGSSGQANYAAANAVLDTLALYRRSHGLPAISVAWGPWSDVGLAAASAERGARLAEMGLGSITPDLGAALFGEILHANPAHAVAMQFDVRRWFEATGSSAVRPLLADLLEQTDAQTTAPSAPSKGIREDLQEAPPGRRRRTLLEAYVQQQVAQVLKLAQSRIDPVKPFRTMGLDSLMGLELRNRLEAGTGVTVPATLVWNYPTVTLLAPEIAVRMGITLDGSSESEPASVIPADAAQSAPTADAPLDVEGLLEQVEALSDDEVRRLLAQELGPT